MQEQWLRLDQIQTPQLRNNLQALGMMDPDFPATLQDPKNREPLLLQRHKQIARCKILTDPPQWLFGETDPDAEYRALSQKIHAIQRHADLFILAGCTIGYGYALMQPLIQKHSEKKVLILEPRASRLWALLALVDISTEIVRGQIFLAIGDCTEDTVTRAITRYGLWQASQVEFIIAPETHTPLNPETIQLRYRQKKLEHETKRSLQLQQLKKNQPQAQKSIRRVLLIDCWNGKPGSLHLQSIHSALQKRGVQTRVLTLNYQRIQWHEQAYIHLNDRRFVETLTDFQPQMILSFGYHAPEMVRRDVYDASHALWVQVVSHLAYQPKTYFPNEKPVLVEKKQWPSFQKKGVTDAVFLPLVANEIAPQPPVSTRKIPLVFVGNSLSMLPHDLQAFQERFQSRSRLQAYCRQAESELSDFDRGINLFHYLEESPPPQVENEEDEYHLFRYLLSQATAARRKQVLEHVTDLGLMLFGGDWERALPPLSPLRACFRQFADEHVKQRLAHNGFIFLNIHSVGNATCPNMRFFNTPGFGNFQLSDQPHFSSFLQADHETAYYSSLSELREKIAFYLAHPEQAEEIQWAGYQRVKADWTYDRWIEKAFHLLQLQFPDR